MFDAIFYVVFCSHCFSYCDVISIRFGKIDCNRYSTAIFFTFCLSNALEPLLF